MWDFQYNFDSNYHHEESPLQPLLVSKTETTSEDKNHHGEIVNDWGW